MVEKLMVTNKDLRTAGICYRDGASPFFKRLGVDPRDLFRDGIDADILIETGDANALRVVEAARGRQ